MIQYILKIVTCVQLRNFQFKFMQIFNYEKILYNTYSNIYTLSN